MTACRRWHRGWQRQRRQRRECGGRRPRRLGRGHWRRGGRRRERLEAEPDGGGVAALVVGEVGGSSARVGCVGAHREDQIGDALVGHDDHLVTRPLELRLVELLAETDDRDAVVHLEGRLLERLPGKVQLRHGGCELGTERVQADAHVARTDHSRRSDHRAGNGGEAHAEPRGAVVATAGVAQLHVEHLRRVIDPPVHREGGEQRRREYAVVPGLIALRSCGVAAFRRRLGRRCGRRRSVRRERPARRRW